MDTKEEAVLVKNALDHYKNCLVAFIKERTRDKGFHDSMFPDINDEIKKVGDIISKISGSPPYRYDGLEASTIVEALDTYARDLAMNISEIEKAFPKITHRQIRELDGKIKIVRAKFL